MSEKNFKAIADIYDDEVVLTPLHEDGLLHDDGERATEKRTRDVRKLKWYERQYGAGFVNGFWLGLSAGFPLAMGVAAVCKWFVDWLLAV